MARVWEYDFKVKLHEESIQAWLQIERQFSFGKKMLEEAGVLGKVRVFSKRIRDAHIFSYENITQEHLDVLLHNFLEPPYYPPDLKAQVQVSWQRDVDERSLVYSVLITANPKTNQIIISGGEVKVLDQKDWKRSESLSEALELAFAHPHVVERRNEPF
ncbi:hypothetical protein HY502_00105 [Candidatus Woesebacteria bacterium]|nr:hypothetical protein [Candidatus Woesebacteria bacterium]